MNMYNEIMIINNEDVFRKILKWWLKSYLQKGDIPDHVWFENALSREGLRVKSESLTSSIVSLDEAMLRLKKAKSRGMGRSEWFYREIASITDGFALDQVGPLVVGLAKSLETALPPELRTLSPGQMSTVRPSTHEREWEQHAIREAVFESAKNIERLTVFGLTRLDEGMESDKERRQQEFVLTERQAEEILLSEHRLGLVMAVAGALQEAVQGKHIVFSFPATPELQDFDPIPILISSSAHRTVRMARIFSDVGRKIKTLEEAVDECIDVAAEAAVGVTKEFFRTAGRELGKAGGRAVGEVFARFCGPQAISVCQNLGARLGEFLGEKVAYPIAEGIKMVAEGARSIVQSGLQKAKDAISSVRDCVKSLWPF